MHEAPCRGRRLCAVNRVWSIRPDRAVSRRVKPQESMSLPAKVMKELRRRGHDSLRIGGQIFADPDIGRIKGGQRTLLDSHAPDKCQ